MDPLSLTAGIASLITLTAQTLRLTKKYVDGVMHAKDSAVALTKELEVLDTSLKRLDAFLKGDSGDCCVVGRDSVLACSTAAGQAKLTALCDKLSAVRLSRRSRLLWPLNKEEHLESIQELRALSQWIQFALTIDGYTLLSKTSENVLGIFKKQLEGFQLLQDVEARAKLIENSIIEQNRMYQNDREERERNNVLAWISSFDYEKKHHSIKTPRVDGTGEWLLQRPEFQEWRDERNATYTLWCHGLQGSGKSVLASLVIDRLRDDDIRGQDAAVAFQYFDYRDQENQSPTQVLRSILRQVAATRYPVPKPTSDLHHRFSVRGRQPELQDLEKALLATCGDFSKVCIVIDALDECDDNKHRRTLMKSIAFLQQSPSVRLFVTSRFHPQDIRTAFEDAPQIEVEANASDLRSYLSREIEDSRAVRAMDIPFRIEVVERIIKAAQKMFLLAVLQIQRILAEPTAGEMEEALLTMPTTLHDAIEETLVRIDRQSTSRRRLGLKTLMWISHSTRPLTIAELSDALTIRSGQTDLNPRYRPAKESIIECCLGLVTVDEESSTIRLVHFSIQEYLRDQPENVLLPAEEEIAEMCLTYLFFDSFASGCCQERYLVEKRIRDYPFLGYVARNWGHHVRQSKADNIKALAFRLIRSPSRRSCAAQIMRFVQGYKMIYWEPDEANSCNELHLASQFGLDDAARQILESRELDVDSTTHIGTTPLISAASRGHSQLVRMLLDAGADVSLENWYGSALHCAAEAGKCDSIEELLPHAADIDIKSSGGQTPLFCAVLEGHITATALLLARGANPNKYVNCFLPAHVVIQKENFEMLRLLLDAGADVEKMGFEGLSALHHAAIQSDRLILDAVLESGLDPDLQATKSFEGHTALFIAAAHGRSLNVQRLLEAGADVNHRSKSDKTALIIAIRNKHKSTQQVLLEFGAVHPSPFEFQILDDEDEEDE